MRFKKLLCTTFLVAGLAVPAIAQNNNPGDDPTGDLKKNPFTNQTQVVSIQGVSVFGTSGYCYTANGATLPPTWQACGSSSGGTPGGVTNALQINGGSSTFAGVASLGTTTTVLHGNASGAPTFGAVALGTDVSGNLAVSHLNSGTGATSSTFWRGDGTWAAAGGGSSTLGTVVGTPTPYVSGDTTSGLYGPSAGNVDVAISGSQAAVFSSTGLNLPAGYWYQIGGNNAINEYNTTLIVGQLAGGGMSATNNSFLTTLVGYKSGENMSYLDTETTCIGGLTCVYLGSSSQHNTVVGDGGMGEMISGSGNAGIGSDVFRDVDAVTGDTGIGTNAFSNCFCSYSSSLGYNAVGGNSSAIIFGGTFTAADVWTLVFTGTDIVSSPVSIQVTIPASPTIATVIAATQAAIQANPPTSISINVAFTAYDNLTISPNVLAIGANGTGTAGKTFTLTSSCSGTCTGSTMTISNGGATGTYNVGIGSNSIEGLQMTSASDNQGVGLATLANLTSGTYNSATGDYSQTNVTSGNDNVSYGYDSLFSAVTTSNDTAIGVDALYNDIGTGGNTAVGKNAGYSLTTATSNTLVGNAAGQYATTPGGTTAFGDHALGGISSTALTGAQNTAMGSSAALNVTTATGMTAVGFAALSGASGTPSTVGQDTAVGYEAGQNTQGTSFGGTYIGYEAGKLVTTGNDNTILGEAVATTTLTTGGHNILIGVDSNTDTVAAATNFSLNINRSITGTMAGGTNPSVCVIGSNCRIGHATGANFNITTDQPITINPMTTTALGYLSSATKYIITKFVAGNCSGANSAVGGLYTATSKGGTALFPNTTTYANCASSTTYQDVALAGSNADSTILTAGTLYFSLSTGNGSALTGDIDIYGIPYN